jgi:hypothetical protein
MSDRPTYIAMACFGDCKVCGKHADLRCGACFDCSGKVAGRVVSRGADGTEVHQLWPTDAPHNRWHVLVPAIPKVSP